MGVRTLAKEIDYKETGFDCPFMLRTENDDELVSFTQQHAKKSHRRNFIQNRSTSATKNLIKTEPDVEIYPLKNLFITGV